jgi:uroporphyrinogen decarboxylase
VRSAPGSPWTGLLWSRAARLDDYRLVKPCWPQTPDLMHRMLAINADSVAYLDAQIGN